MSMDLKEMKKGENRLPLALQQGEDTPPVARLSVRGQRSLKWFFESDSVKQMVDRPLSSGQDIVYDVAMDVGQAELPSLEFER